MIPIFFPLYLDVIRPDPVLDENYYQKCVGTNKTLTDSMKLQIYILIFCAATLVDVYKMLTRKFGDPLPGGLMIAAGLGGAAVVVALEVLEHMYRQFKAHRNKP